MYDLTRYHVVSYNTLPFFASNMDGHPLLWTPLAIVVVRPPSQLWMSSAMDVPWPSLPTTFQVTF